MVTRRSILALPVLAALPATAVRAQEYPSRTIRIVVPVTPGSGTDATARHMANGLSKAWGVPAIVENRPGAGVSIGTDLVAKAAPDGHTLLFTYAAHYSSPWVDKVPYDPIKDFEPVARLATSALVVVTSPASPYKTIADVLAAARQRPGAVTYASAGTGTTGHMAAALFSSMAGVSLAHVPYKAASQVALDAAGGVVDLAFGGLASSLPLIKGGRLRVLAVTTTNRSLNLPDVPTLAEAGLPGYENSSPIWALAPRGTPAAIVAKVSEALTRIAGTPEFKEFCIAQGFEVDIQNAATFRASAAAESEKWRKLVALTRDKA